MALEDLKGLGPTRVDRLNEQGIHSLSDLVEYLPRRYDVRSISRIHEVENGTSCYLEGVISSDVSVFFIRKSLSRLTFKASVDGTVFTIAVFNQHYLKKTLSKGDTVALYAKVDHSKKTLTAQRVIKREHFMEGIIPVYNLSGISDKVVQKLVRQAFESISAWMDPVPSHLLDSYGYPKRHEALFAAHFPRTLPSLRKALARLRYEALLFYQLRVMGARRRRQHQKGTIKSISTDVLKEATCRLPFDLSPSQDAALDSILADLRDVSPMRRMLQGDTGSGKTVVAMLAAFATIRSGYQVAFMAPTEILAQQQYDEANAFLDTFGVEIRLLTQNASDERDTLDALEAGRCDLVVGTHRLFSDDVRFSALGLVITDEQHRFGVAQRKRLFSKGDIPDILYLSATPIPRTLAMTLFGDMDISTIERPSNRARSVETAVRTMRSEQAAMNAVARRLKRGEQVYVVAPTIDEQETLNGVKTLFRKYSERFRDQSVAMLHGRLSAQEKRETLKAFKDRSTDILVSTTVIEVGIHAPGATLMVIYHGERFGYAQLHQLRGRVGREGSNGACVILCKDDAWTVERLKILETTNDGFELSEVDLDRRGFGDLVGTRQSGSLDILRKDEEGDMALFEQASLDAEVIMERHERKASEETDRLIEHVNSMFFEGETV